MADVKWIKITTDIFDNRKIRQIECLPEGDAIIVIWMKLLILSGNINDDGLIYFTKEIPYTEQMLASHFNRPLTTVQFALKTFEQFGMIEVIDNMLRISNWEKYQNTEGMDKIREQTRKRVAKHRERKMLLQSEDSNVNVTLPNATDKNRKELDIDKEINKENSCTLAVDFEKAWINTFEKYPKKSSPAVAKQVWMRKLLNVVESNRQDVATLIYQATKLYLADYEKNSNDSEFKYIPKYGTWLEEDCDYWISLVENSRKENT